MKGRVKFYDFRKGWGFITSESGEDYFVHWRDIVGKGRRVLNTGETVAFELGEARTGGRVRSWWKCCRWLA